MSSPSYLDRLRQSLEAASWFPVPVELLLPRCSPCPGDTFHVEIQHADEVESHHASVCVLRQSVSTLALVELDGASLPSRQEIYNRYQDFSFLERLLLWGLARQMQCELLVVLCNERANVFAVEDECLLETEISVEDLPEVLAKIVESQQPQDTKGLGLELRQWIDLNAGVVGPALKWSRPEAERLLRQMLLGCKMILHKSDGTAYMGLHVHDAPGRRYIKWLPPRPDNRIAPLLEAASAHAPEGAGAFSPLERKALNRQMIEIDGLDARLMRSLMQLSVGKMMAKVQLRAFIDHENEHAAWKLALTDPLQIDKIILSDNLYVHSPVTIDLAQSGIGRVWEAIEKLAEHAVRLDHQLARSGGRQLDIFEKQPEGLSKHERLEDPFGWLLRHALRVKLGPDHDRETVGYLVASGIADIQRRSEFKDIRSKPLRSLPYLFS